MKLFIIIIDIYNPLRYNPFVGRNNNYYLGTQYHYYLSADS